MPFATLLLALAPGLPQDLDTLLLESIDATSLAEWHEKIASFPHDVGTPGDDRRPALELELRHGDRR